MRIAQTITTPNGDVVPVLFHDFNSPARSDGTFMALPNELLSVEPGQRVLFGCVSDEMVEKGVVVAVELDGQLIRIRAEED